mgnify:CR=1 FL=1
MNKVERVKYELRQLERDREQLNKILDKRIKMAEAAIKRLENRK